MKYIITVLSVLLTLTALLSWQYQKENKYLDTKNKEIEAQYELVKAHILNQNEAIRRANEKMKGYQKDIGILRKEYDLKLSAYQKQVKSIKTCEDGFKYLKNMLEGLK